jgi:hypothetical protein
VITTQRETTLPQIEVEVDIAQITKALTSQTWAVTKRNKRTMVSLRSPPRTRKRRKQTQETTEAVQDETEHPEELQNVMEYPLQENVQDIDQTR